MTGKKCMESLLLGVWMCGAGYGEHGPLLPRPQQIRYGTGSVAVRGTRILFSAAPNAEDRLGAALGRWDAEYQYWRGVHGRLRHFNESTHSGDALPPLDEVIESPRPSWARAH